MYETRNSGKATGVFGGPIQTVEWRYNSTQVKNLVDQHCFSPNQANLEISVRLKQGDLVVRLCFAGLTETTGW